MSDASSTAIPQGSTGRFFELLARAREVCKGLLFAPRGRWDPVVVDPAMEWRRYWGDTYGPELKKWMLKPVFEEMERDGRLGDVIIDVGSGAHPVTELIERRAGRKRVLVDIAADEGCVGDAVRVRLDVEGVARAGALSVGKAVVRARRFLNAPDAMGADLIIFSDLLNYVDFRAVLRGAVRFLKAGGRVMVVNLPTRGNPLLFSERGLKDNYELYRFLDEEGFRIEHKSFPCRARGSTAEGEELLILVARSRGGC